MERRKAPRSATLIAATAVISPDRAVDCTVRDLSSAGARISCASAADFPDTFELHMPSRGRAHRVRMRWQVGREMGVSLETAIPLRGTRVDALA